MNKILSVSILTFMIVILSLPKVKAQSSTQDVVYIKGGSIYRGIIKAQTDKNIQLLTIGSNLMTIDNTMVDSVKQEHIPSGYYMPVMIRNKGYFNVTDIGLMIGENTNGFEVETVNGYRFNRWLNLGGGIGFQISDAMLFPVFGSVRSEFLKTSTTPVFFADAGYNFASPRNNVYYYEPFYYPGDEKVTGGFYGSAGFGIKFRMRSEVAISIGAAYAQNRWQRTYSYSGGEKYNYKYTNQRMCLKFGVEF